MPLYQYECSKCQKVHELMQKLSDAPLDQCPDCGSSVARIMGSAGFIFKGAGFYTTDYKRKNVGGECGAGQGAGGSCAKPGCAN